MNNTHSNTTSSQSRRKTEAAIGAIAGVCIGETARQMIQYDDVPWWRVVMFIVGALVGGGVIALTFFKPATTPTASDESRRGRSADSRETPT